MPFASPTLMTVLVGTTAALGAATEVTLTLSTRSANDGGGPLPKLRIARVKIRRTAGTAASFAPRIFRATGAAAGDVTQAYEGASTAVGTLHDGVPSDAWTQTDANGILYLVVAPNAGADNTFNYEVWFEVAA